jgi:uncharacterized protein YbjQ (UPF0145 family)
MANCIECGTSIGFLNKGYEGRCTPCASSFYEKEREKEIADSAKREQEQAKINSAIDAILLTTETAPNLKISKRIEIVTAEVAYGMNIFKDLFAGVRDIVGGRSDAVQATMRDARRTALFELKKEAYSAGANAVVGVDLDYVELSGSSNMVMLVASGTAVVIEHE